MKRSSRLIPVLTWALLSLPLLAIAGESGKCEADAQACLDKMVKSFEEQGWLGIEMDDSKEAEAMVITRVVPESPAETAGFQVGDIFAGYAGLRLADASKEELAAAKKTLTKGAEVTYMIVRDGQEMELTATLAPLPEQVMAQWIGTHMLKDHVQMASASAE